ncbi:MAG: hypothetical protein AUK47_15750 [Deltaproteobacteria bacterium CG2_30_63_29]|nr:MAG: hypothetical protein AUK47_15750 [Deltaproteobacteria bacterium CG2_30_63_29]
MLVAALLFIAGCDEYDPSAVSYTCESDGDCLSGYACFSADGAASVCTLESERQCADGFGDCDGEPTRCEVDLRLSTAHCGACGASCAEGLVCTGGVCIEECSAPTLACGGNCVDVTQNVAHCGGCGNACSTGEFCVGGGCFSDCPVGTTACDQTCADLTQNVSHCGSCGNACASGEFCAGGGCVRNCPTGTQACDQTCVDVSQNALHCGACGSACGSGEFCVGGACVSDCPASTRACDAACVDVLTNREHCGSCEHACEAAERCVGGACGPDCPPGTQSCAGLCVDLLSNPQHCGVCSKSCGTGEVCSAGSCGLQCLTGTQDCSGACVDLQRNVFHCGACGSACGTNEECNAGSCVCSADATQCGERCVLTAQDPLNCGACDASCGANKKCVSGACGACVTGFEDCNNQAQDGCEADLMNDATNCGVCATNCRDYGHSYPVCHAGKCDIGCFPERADCNNIHMDGCEVDLTWAKNHCGVCNSPCGSNLLNGCFPGGLCTITSYKRKLVASGTHVCVLNGQGSLWCWGENNRGQVGIGSQIGPVETPQPIELPDISQHVIDVAVGPECTIATRSDGSVWGWGINTGNWQNTGTMLSQPLLIPTPVDDLLVEPALVGLDLGTSHACRIDSSGTLECWGANQVGQLGRGSALVIALPPEPIDLLPNVFEAALGPSYSCARLQSGEAYCWGANSFGQLGDGTTSNRSVPTLIPDLLVQDLDVYGSTSCAVGVDGELYCWGQNDDALLFGRPGGTYELDPTHIDGDAGVKYTRVEVGQKHVCALSTAGEVYCWGAGARLGDGTEVASRALVKGDIVDANGNAVAIFDLAAGAEFTCALSVDREEVYCWGDNSAGQLGLDGVAPSAVPVLSPTLMTVPF